MHANGTHTHTLQTLSHILFDTFLFLLLLVSLFNKIPISFGFNSKSENTLIKKLNASANEKKYKKLFHNWNVHVLKCVSHSILISLSVYAYHY